MRSSSMILDCEGQCITFPPACDAVGSHASGVRTRRSVNTHRSANLLERFAPASGQGGEGAATGIRVMIVVSGRLEDREPALLRTRVPGRGGRRGAEPPRQLSDRISGKRRHNRSGGGSVRASQHSARIRTWLGLRSAHLLSRSRTARARFDGRKQRGYFPC